MLRIVPATTEEQLQQASELIAELARWDAEQSRQRGLDPEEVLKCFYPSDAETLRQDSAPPAGCLLLATFADVPAGCAGIRRLDATVCELYNVYVREAARGQHIGRRMIEQLIDVARRSGYTTMRLETTPFMPEAQKLYRSSGFKPRDVYREIPSVFAPWTLAMELSLRAAD